MSKKAKTNLVAGGRATDTERKRWEGKPVFLFSKMYRWKIAENGTWTLELVDEEAEIDAMLKDLRQAMRDQGVTEESLP